MDEQGLAAETSSKMVSQDSATDQGNSTPVAKGPETPQSQSRMPLLSSIYTRILAFVPKMGQTPKAPTPDAAKDLKASGPDEGSEKDEAPNEHFVIASEDDDSSDADSDSDGAEYTSAEPESPEQTALGLGSDGPASSLTRLNATNTALQRSIANLVQVVEDQQPADNGSGSSEEESEESEEEDEEEESSTEEEDAATTERARKRRRVGAEATQSAEIDSSDEVQDSEDEDESGRNATGEKGRKRKRRAGESG